MQLTCAPIDQNVAWHGINWAAAYVQVRRIQSRIVKATQEGRWNKVSVLQRLLTSSFYGKALAVRRVTENKGKRTAGVDDVTWSTPAAKTKAIDSLTRQGYKPMPLRRIYIPKSNGKMRPLSIPTMRDRAMQALHLLALDPVSEVVSDGQSYGFRKERSTHDAIGQCFLNGRYLASGGTGMQSRQSAQWVLEGDIRGCFDNIDHEWLIANVPMDKVILRKWLKAGYMEGSVRGNTEQGTPQGGVISPVLANFALNGLEDALKGAFKNTHQFNKAKINLVRYADDFVITGISKELLETTVQPAVTNFLAIRGLQLAPEKTKITHLAEGYDFLGQNIRKYGDKLLIKPATKNVQAFLQKVRGMIRKLCAAPQQTVIGALNPMIAGWAMYHRHVVSKEIFAKVDHRIWYALWRWAKRRHPKKTPRWINKRYFHQIGTRRWVFAVLTGEKRADGTADYRGLNRASGTSIERHQKIKSNANPYDPNWEEYFEERTSWRMRLSLQGRRRFASLWMSQQGKCLVCDQILEIGHWHVHHLIERSRGGKAVASNEVLLHDVCHKQVHNQSIKLSKPGP